MLLLSGCVYLPVWGQAEDPFGTGAAPTVAEPLSPLATTDSETGLTATTPRTEDSSAVVQSLRASPPQTPVEYGRAILYLSRIERWEEIGGYLERLGQQQLDDAAADRIVRATGLDPWFLLAGKTKELKREQRAVADRIIAGATRAVRQEAVLQAAIDQLYHADLAMRKRGLLGIQGAGDDGLAGLLEFVASDRQPIPVAVAEVIASLGQPGSEALKAGMTASDSLGRDRLLMTAAKIPGPDYIAELSAGLYSVATDSPAHAALVKALSPSGQALPSPAAVHRYLEDQMMQELRQYQAMGRDSEVAVEQVWRWSDDGKRLQPELDDRAGWHLEKAYRLAVFDVRTAPPTEHGLAAAVLFERDGRRTPVVAVDAKTMGKAMQRAELLYAPEPLGAVWKAAVDHRLYWAQLRAVQAMQWLYPQATEADRARLVTHLRSALGSSVPAVRYQAAVALQAAAKGKPFAAGAGPEAPGNYAWQQVLREGGRLQGKPLAMIVGGDIERRDVLSKQLSELGIRATTLASAREALQYIQQPEPIEMIFVVDKVLEMSVSELVQRLRSHPRAAVLPLAILQAELSNQERALLETLAGPAISWGILSTKLESTSDLLQRMGRSQPLPRLDTLDRLTLQTLFERPSPAVGTLP
jgi:CheY-like chemotaxis protein